MANEGSLPSTQNPPLGPILSQTTLAHVLSSKSKGQVHFRTGHEGQGGVEI
jgi:hypothetical protein